MSSFLWMLLGLVGIWFLASAATADGLLPNGHGLGRVFEIAVGLLLVGYAGFRAWKQYGGR